MPDNDNNNDNDNDNDDRRPTNPFIRFRQHVDANIHAGLGTLLSLSRSSSSNSSSCRPSNPNNPARHPSSTPPSTSTTPTTTMPPPSSHYHPQDDAHQSQSHLESRLDALRGGTRDEALLAWRLFLTRSAYSPLRLAHELGWQPTPRCGGGDDLPAAQQFGWLDAFEDLMRVSSGRGLSDLREKRGTRAATSSSSSAADWEVTGLSGFPGAVWGGWGDWGRSSTSRWDGGDSCPLGIRHPHQHRVRDRETGRWGVGLAAEAAWLERMKADGLTEVLFPVYDPQLGHRSPRTMQEWVDRRRAEDSRAGKASRIRDELEGRREAVLEEAKAERERVASSAVEEARAAREEWERKAWGDDNDEREKRPSFFSEIGEIVKLLGKVLEDEVKSLPGFGRGEEDREGKDKDKDAQTEGDLYSVIQSAFHESERSLSKFFKSVSEGWRDASLREREPSSPPKTETTEVVENGITKMTTRNEFVDEYGNRHSKTETTWKDENGRVIMRQVQSSVGRSEHWQRTADGWDADEKRDTETKQDDSKEQKKEGSGWFWK